MSGNPITLPPGGRFRRHAGPYEPDTSLPRYSVEISGPDDHACSLVEDNCQVMGTPGNHFYVWDFKNCSAWPIFLTLIINGVPIEQH